MSTYSIECSLNAPSAIKHNNSNNLWTNFYDEEIVLNRGDVVNCMLGVVNTTLTGEEYIEINDSNNTGTIGVQFFIDGSHFTDAVPIAGATVYGDLEPPADGNFSNWPYLTNIYTLPARGNFLTYSNNANFVQQNLIITIPNGFYTPSEIATIINRAINKPFAQTRTLNTLFVPEPATTAVVNPFCTLIYSTNYFADVAGMRATKYDALSLPEDFQNVSDASGAINRLFAVDPIFQRFPRVIGATAPVFQFDPTRNRFSFSNLHSPMINWTSSNSPSFLIDPGNVSGGASTTFTYYVGNSFAVLKLSDEGLWDALGFNTIPLADVIDQAYSVPARWGVQKLSTLSVPNPSVEWTSSANNVVPTPSVLSIYYDQNYFYNWNTSLAEATRSPLVLNTIGYYLLRSDICDEVSFFSSQAKQAINVVAFLNKNYQSSVFYYCFTQSQPIQVRKNKILKSITIELLNPDLSIPSKLLENTTIIFQVQSRPQPIGPMLNPITDEVSVLGADVDLALIAEEESRQLVVKSRKTKQDNEDKEEHKDA